MSLLPKARAQSPSRRNSFSVQGASLKQGAVELAANGTREIPTFMNRRCPSKDCSGCGRRKPATHFARNTRDASGLQPWCKSCHRKYHSEKPKVLVPTVHRKRCSTCHKTKPVREFNKDVSKPTGLRSQCNACRSERRHAQRSGDWRRLRRSANPREPQSTREKKRTEEVDAPVDAPTFEETPVASKRSGQPPLAASRRRSALAEVQKCEVAETPFASLRFLRALSPSELRLAALLTVADYESTNSTCNRPSLL